MFREIENIYQETLTAQKSSKLDQGLQTADLNRDTMIKSCAEKEIRLEKEKEFLLKENLEFKRLSPLVQNMKKKIFKYKSLNKNLIRNIHQKIIKSVKRNRLSSNVILTSKKTIKSRNSNNNIHQ